MQAALSQMPFGFWVLGNSEKDVLKQQVKRVSLKCLSAFGFWGTLHSHPSSEGHDMCLKCLSAFGFWGTRHGQ